MSQVSFEPDLSAWDAWHPSDVARHLASVDGTWYVTAGWALDLFQGRQTRDHDDIEVAVPAHGFSNVRLALPEFELYAIADGLAHPRDSRVRLPRTRVIARTEDGIPFAHPEIALLYKARAVRKKDEEDFAAVLPLLDPSRRNWLSEALTLVHPGHRWLEALRAGSTDTAAR